MIPRARGAARHSKGPADAVMHLTNKSSMLVLKYVRLLLDVVQLPSGVISCVLRDLLTPAYDQGPRRDPRAEENDCHLLDALTKFGPDGARFTKWMDATGLPRSTFRGALKRLSKGNQVTLKNKVYFLTETGPKSETGAESGF